MKKLLMAGVLILVPFFAFAQTTATYTTSATESGTNTGAWDATYTATVESSQSGKVMVDLEAYNSPGAIFSNQGTQEMQAFTLVDLTAGVPMTCTWTSPLLVTAGYEFGVQTQPVTPPFTLKVGLFTPDWSQLLNWNNAAGIFSNVFGFSATTFLGLNPNTVLVGCSAATTTPADTVGHVVMIGHVMNTHGGTKTANDFEFGIYDSTSNSYYTASFNASGLTIDIPPGNYVAYEGHIAMSGTPVLSTAAGYSGYSESVSTDCNGTIAAGETKTCTIQISDNTASSTATSTPPIAPPTTSSGQINQNGQSVRAGASIDFIGHNFGHEESVVVSLNGTTVTTAHADGGGNFSTGSLSVPSTAGTYIYTFTGQTSGITGSATISVVP